MVKIKDVTKLRKVLKEGGNGKIVVWKDGRMEVGIWSQVGMRESIVEINLLQC
ncbi:hypothetical protein MHB65_20070 [Lysinibacillus sp. FSL K6-0075]|uniref:hypothetical protein n=1 Tax=Lysinibacillus sp. FSL K6-0075 TaxID=2921415 RepID=UPI003158F1C6